MRPHEIQSRMREVGHGDAAGVEGGELQHGQADRARADHQHIVILRQRRARDGVAADAERFDEREHVEILVRHRVKEGGRNRQQIAHPAVDVDAQDPQVLAAVRPSAPRRPRLWIVQERADDAGIPDTKGRVGLRIARQRLDGHGQLVTKDARIAEERLAPRERVQVGAADANPAHADERVAGGRDRIGDLPKKELAGLL